ncbi:MAG TPA: putative beta-lysine N-acetyltransferase [candidate division WOR-3 bacterium]|uniref:Beta-lysine N-acetyltransferase n=1 Tax=candidate division WOR-3 bacterium TaxID=2052148 RepID=A0A7V0T6X4_UNCW3|nr:putative beta-lysine N-acetyltransferase [candidate division WOR-3 bacterium]
MKARPGDTAELLARFEELVRERGYSKVSAKVPEAVGREFVARGYAVEAKMPAMYRGAENGLFLARFFTPGRELDTRAEADGEVLRNAQSRAGRRVRPALPSGRVLRACEEADASALAALYRETFDSYPFPVDDPAHIRRAMRDETLFAGVWDGALLVAAASAEMDREGGNAEMTDFATRPARRGRSLAGNLLGFLERRATERGIRTAYTIARAASVGMNVVFARLGYRWAGRLVNNTNIAGRLESMNVWFRPLEGGGRAGSHRRNRLARGAGKG